MGWKEWDHLGPICSAHALRPARGGSMCIRDRQGLQGGPEVLGQKDDVHADSPGGFDSVPDFFGKGVDCLACIADVEGPGFDFDVGLAGVGVRHSDA